MRPTGYGVQGYEPHGQQQHRGYGVQGVWATWAIGHMANGAHGQWGTWAMGPMGNGAHGPMGDWDIFAHSIIITGWIHIKILLHIDTDVFCLNTGRFLHDGLKLSIFRWILNSVC